MTERRIAECTTSNELVRTLCDLIRFYNFQDTSRQFELHVMSLVEDAENEIDGIAADEYAAKIDGAKVIED